MYNPIVTQIKEMYPHPKGDNIQLAKMWGSQVVISKTVQEGDWGIYFPTDGELSFEFTKNNNLHRDELLNADPKVKGFFEKSRRVRTQKFLGENSDGFWIPLDSLAYLKLSKEALDAIKDNGKPIPEINGITIAKKYTVIHSKERIPGSPSPKNDRSMKIISEMFKEHYDTSQLAYNLHKIDESEPLWISEKLHGTSQRAARVKVVVQERGRFSSVKNFFAKIVDRLGYAKKEPWILAMGTRRVSFLKMGLDEIKGTNPFHDPTMREVMHKEVTKMPLKKGEGIFFEVVGFEPSGKPIMPAASYKKLGKEFKSFGENVPFSYGCEPKECKAYVYRISMTNEDGDSVDLPFPIMLQRCEELGLTPVPFLKLINLQAIKDMRCDDPMDYFEDLAKGVSSLDMRHLKEGIVVHTLRTAYKHKSFEFKVLEGIIKDSGIADMEEADGEL